MASTFTSDEDCWIAEFRKGNTSALEHVFELYHRALCYFADSIIKEQQEAEDIVAMTFMKTWEKHTNFKTAQNLKAFLYITTKNACLDYLRRSKRQSVAQQEYFYQLTSEEDYIINHMIEAEVLKQLNLEIERLPEKCREVFKLIYIEGLKTDEIAHQLNLSVKTVRNHKARAVAFLQTAILKGTSLHIVFYLLMLFV